MSDKGNYLAVKRKDLSKKEQLDIIYEVDREYASHFTKDFDDSIFYRQVDNFKCKEHIESVQLAKQDLKTKPRFSIAIPNYRRIEQLKRAIDSALNQDFDEEYEVLVVENSDDFSDNSVFDSIIKDYKGKISYFKNKENLGLFGNWNRCLKLSQGEWMCCLHSDDMILPAYLKEMKKLVNNKKYADAALVGCVPEGSVFGFKKRHRFIRKFFNNAYLDRAMGLYMLYNLPANIANDTGGGGGNLAMQAFSMHPTARLHNREKCIKFGGYHDGDFYPSEDNFFLTRLIHHGYKIYNYQAKPLHIRGYENNYGHSPKVHLQWGVNDSRIIFTLAGKGKFALDRFIEYLSYKAKDLKNINCHYMALYLDMILLYLNNPKGFKDFQIQDEFSESLILKNLLKDPFDIYNLK